MPISYAANPDANQYSTVQYHMVQYIKYNLFYYRLYLYIHIIICCDRNMSSKRALVRWSEISLLLVERDTV